VVNTDDAWLDGYRSGLGLAAIKAGDLAAILRAVKPADELADIATHPLDILAMVLRTHSACASLSDVPKDLPA
jgi:hypothetical protein